MNRVQRAVLAVGVLVALVVVGFTLLGNPIDSTPSGGTRSGRSTFGPGSGSRPVLNGPLPGVVVLALDAIGTTAGLLIFRSERADDNE